MENNISKSTLFNFFSGNATPLQRQVVSDWLKKEENKELFYEWLKEWENEHPQFIPNDEAAFQKFKQKRAFEGNEEQQHIPVVVKKQKFLLYRIAATLFLAALASWFFKDEFLFRTYKTGFGEIKTITLEEGSSVVLNSNSRLRVPRFGFAASERKVQLTGEGEFSIKHTATDQKFIVEATNGLHVEVLGTEFLVYARNDSNRVILQKGKVKVSNGSSKTLSVDPGEIVTLDNNGELRKETIEDVEIYSAWKDNRFVFNRTKLSEVAKMVHDNFGVQIVFDDTALSEITMTGTFKAMSAGEMINMITDIAGLDVTLKGNTYHIQHSENTAPFTRDSLQVSND